MGKVKSLAGDNRLSRREIFHQFEDLNSHSIARSFAAGRISPMFTIMRGLNRDPALKPRVNEAWPLTHQECVLRAPV